MTRQDRELAIQDNVEYVGRVVAALRAEWPIGGRIVFAGFSQGVAMAFRAAVSIAGAPVIACGGDIPPELPSEHLARIPAAFVGRGAADAWYTQAKFEADLARLRAARVDAASIVFDAGHEWAPPFAEAAAAFLRTRT
jgi:predicted esterase